MEILKNIRRQLGITQYALATLLEITRDHLAMAETNKRIITATAAQRLAWLLPLLPPENKAPLPTPTLTGETITQLKMRLLKAEGLQYDLQKDLAAKETRYRQTIALQQLLTNINGVAQFPLSGKQKNLLEELAYQNALHNPTELLQQIAMLQLELSALAQQMALYQAAITAANT
jgi:DNA-binding XRE family transcriptional regulator